MTVNQSELHAKSNIQIAMHRATIWRSSISCESNATWSFCALFRSWALLSIQSPTRSPSTMMINHRTEAPKVPQLDLDTNIYNSTGKSSSLAHSHLWCGWHIFAHQSTLGPIIKLENACDTFDVYWMRNREIINSFNHILGGEINCFSFGPPLRPTTPPRIRQAWRIFIIHKRTPCHGQWKWAANGKRDWATGQQRQSKSFVSCVGGWLEGENKMTNPFWANAIL